MLNVFLPIAIVGVFIGWFFAASAGIIGCILLLAFYWILFFSGRGSSRQKLDIFKDQIIKYFSVYGSKTGQQHFNYIYDNAHYYIMPMASKGFSSANSIITIGCLITGIISIFKGDWYSLGACIIFYGFAANLSSKFNKPYFDLQAAKDESITSFDTNYSLTGYSEFFAEKWPKLIREEMEKRKNGS